MAKDSRLYGQFTLDFPDHEKIAILSDSAFRMLVEMTLYSRRMLTDGRVSKRLAHAKWSLESATELLENASDNPSIYEDGDDYIIHDFAAHQTTKAEVEAMREQKREAGRKGGLAKKANQAAKTSKRVAPAKQAASKRQAKDKQASGSTPSETWPETETETETIYKGGTEISNSTTAREDETDHAPKPSSLDELAARYASEQTQKQRGICPRHPNGNPTGEPCRMCGQAKTERAEDAQAKKQARRAAIDACQLCDTNGMRLSNGQARRCTHQQPPF